LADDRSLYRGSRHAPDLRVRDLALQGGLAAPPAPTLFEGDLRHQSPSSRQPWQPTSGPFDLT
jgi:hypothetical protein